MNSKLFKLKALKVRYFENMSRRKQSRPIRVLEDEELGLAPRPEGDPAEAKDKDPLPANNTGMQ